MDQLEQDIYNATMYKLAYYADKMEKIATPKLRAYLTAAGNRTKNIGEITDALKQITNSVNISGYKKLLDPKYNIGAIGNKAKNMMTGGLADAVKSKQVDIDLAANILSAMPKEVMRDNLDGLIAGGGAKAKYLKKIIPNVDDEVIKAILKYPNFIMK